VLTDFRCRQHHEQAYRVGVYDEFLDAAPCGYDKESPERKRPRFKRGGLQLIGWLVALVYNAVANLAEELRGDYGDSHIRTIRRTFFNRPGTLYLTPGLWRKSGRNRPVPGVLSSHERAKGRWGAKIRGHWPPRKKASLPAPSPVFRPSGG